MYACLFCGDGLLLFFAIKLQNLKHHFAVYKITICSKGSLYVQNVATAQLSTSPEENNCHISCETDKSRQLTFQVKGANKINEAVSLSSDQGCPVKLQVYCKTWTS